MMRKVLVNLRRGAGDPLYEYLKARLERSGFEVVKTNWQRDQCDQLLKDARECCAVVSGVELWDAASLQAASENIRLITRVGSGCDNIDVLAATKCGIAVMSTAGSNASAVAEGALALMLSLCRRIALSDRTMRSGVWNNGLLTTELAGKTVGIVGYGRIGSRLAKLLSGFDVRILAYNHSPKEAIGVEFVDLDRLVRESDFISVHVPATAESAHMFNKTVFEKMKPSAFFINTSRGAVVAEDDLIEALENGTIAGAALDVFEQEPLPPDSPLLKLDQVVVTPHVQSASKESAFKTMEMTAENVRLFFDAPRKARTLNPAYIENV